MGIKVYKARTPGRRNMTGFDFKEITKDTPEKSLTEPIKRQGGRNNRGRITTVSYTHLTLPTTPYV